MKNIEIYQSEKNQRWYFRIKANNGEIIAVGSETDGYVSKRDAERGVNAVLRVCQALPDPDTVAMPFHASPKVSEAIMELVDQLTDQSESTFTLEAEIGDIKIAVTRTKPQN